MAQNEPTTFKTYVNSTYGYSIQYPSDWIARNFLGFYRGFFAPQPINCSEPFSPNVIVGVVQVPANMSAEQINGVMINPLNAFNDFHLIASDDITLAGNPAHRILFTDVQPPVGVISQIEVWTIKDNIAYLIIFIHSTENDRFF